MHELASKHRRSGMYSHWNTHMQPRAYIHKHVYGVISRSGALPLAQTHTNAERGGQMESQRGLLAFHTLETWFLTVPSPSPTLFPLVPLPTYPLSSALSHLSFCLSCSFYLTFLFVLRLQAFSFCKQYMTKVDCIEQIVQFTVRQAFSEDTVWLQRYSGRSRVITLWCWRKNHPVLSYKPGSAL